MSSQPGVQGRKAGSPLVLPEPFPTPAMEAIGTWLNKGENLTSCCIQHKFRARTPVPQTHAGILVIPITGKWLFSWFDQTFPASGFRKWKETKQIKKKENSQTKHVPSPRMLTPVRPFPRKDLVDGRNEGAALLNLWCWNRAASMQPTIQSALFFLTCLISKAAYNPSQDNHLTNSNHFCLFMFSNFCFSLQGMFR